MLSPVHQPRHYFFDGNKRPLVGGRIEYVGIIYQDVFKTAPHKNPIYLDEKGSALMYFDSDCQLTLYDRNSQLIGTQILPARREWAFFYDKFGYPLRFGKVFTYHAVSTQAKPSYGASDMSIVHDNPVLLDGDGKAQIYINAPYRLRVYHHNDVLVGDEDVLIGDVPDIPDTPPPISPPTLPPPAIAYQGRFTLDKSGRFTKNDCTSGTGSEVLFEKSYIGEAMSDVSQDEADRLAQEMANQLALSFETEGQVYANEHGECIPDMVTPPPPMTTPDHFHEGGIVFTNAGQFTGRSFKQLDYLKKGIVDDSFYTFTYYNAVSNGIIPEYFYADLGDTRNPSSFMHSTSIYNYINFIDKKTADFAKNIIAPAILKFYKDNPDILRRKVEHERNAVHGIPHYEVLDVHVDELQISYKGNRFKIFNDVNIGVELNAIKNSVPNGFDNGKAGNANALQYTLLTDFDSMIYDNAHRREYENWQGKSFSDILKLHLQEIEKIVINTGYFRHGRQLLKNTSYAAGEIVRKRATGMFDSAGSDIEPLPILNIAIDPVFSLTPLRYKVRLHDGQEVESVVNFDDIIAQNSSEYITIHATYVYENFSKDDEYYDIYPYGDNVIMHEKEAD